MIPSRTASPLRLPIEQTSVINFNRLLVVFDGGTRTFKWTDLDHPPRLIPVFIKGSCSTKPKHSPVSP